VVLVRARTEARTQRKQPNYFTPKPRTPHFDKMIVLHYPHLHLRLFAVCAGGKLLLFPSLPHVNTYIFLYEAVGKLSYFRRPHRSTSCIMYRLKYLHNAKSVFRLRCDHHRPNQRLNAHTYACIRCLSAQHKQLLVARGSLRAQALTSWCAVIISRFFCLSLSLPLCEYLRS
jgi:hypothetical protein